MRRGDTQNLHKYLEKYLSDVKHVEYYVWL